MIHQNHSSQKYSYKPSSSSIYVMHPRKVFIIAFQGQYSLLHSSGLVLLFGRLSNEMVPEL